MLILKTFLYFLLRPCDRLIVMHLPCVADTIFDQRIDYTSIWYCLGFIIINGANNNT